MYPQRISLLILLPVPSLSGSDLHGDPSKQIVIAHRGASGYRPEHTLAGYRLAIEQGADYIEPDLVLTRDGALVPRHDHFLSTTTDVADHPGFADRKKKVGDQEDWFVEDFTLDEIRTLRARQAFEGRSAEYGGVFRIPTFSEVINLVQKESARTGRTIGIYPETKMPNHFQSLGYDFASILLEELKQIRGEIPVFIQSFEPGILRELYGRTEYPLIQLVSPARDPMGGMKSSVPNIPLGEISQFAAGVGAMKFLLIDDKGEPTSFVRDAHELGLHVHIWTIRDDAVPKRFFKDVQEELRFFLGLGIDGFFTDFPDTGVSVRDTFFTTEPQKSGVTHSN